MDDAIFFWNISLRHVPCHALRDVMSKAAGSRPNVPKPLLPAGGRNRRVTRQGAGTQARVQP
jgi:hypothetical protein